MKLQLNIKREYFSEIFNEIYIEHIESKKDQLQRQYKRIISILAFTIFNYFAVSSVVALLFVCVFIIPFIIILYKIYNLKKEIIMKFDYPEDYYKKLESRNSITLLLNENTIELYEDDEKTVWNVIDIYATIIKTHYIILYFKSDYTDSLFVPKKCLSNEDFEEYNKYLKEKLNL